MNTAKHAAQDLWELISGHPTNTTTTTTSKTKTRPTIHRQPAATYTTYAHKEPEDPTVTAVHAKKEKAQHALVRAKAAVMQAKKYGDEKALAKARAVRSETSRELDEAREEELNAILEVNRGKRERREKEKGNVGGGGGGSGSGKGNGNLAQKIKFQNQSTPNGKVVKGGSDGVGSVGVGVGVGVVGVVGASASVVPPNVPADGQGSQKSMPGRTSKAWNPDKTIVPMVTETNRQLGDNERTFLEGLLPEDAGSGVHIPSATPARVSRIPSSRKTQTGGQTLNSRTPPPNKPPIGSQNKTIVPPDTTIPPDRTESNRQLGDMNRTYIEGVNTPSEYAKWNQTNVGQRPSSRAPTSKQPPSANLAKTITPSPSTPIPQIATEMNRPIGDMNRTYIEGVHTPSEYARWSQTNVGQPPPSRAPASRPPPASMPPASRNLANSILPQTAFHNPTTRKPASNPPQTAFHNPSIPQIQTEMRRQLGNNDRTYIAGMAQNTKANTTYQQPRSPPHDATILPDARSEFNRGLGDNQRTILEGMVLGSQTENLTKVEKKEGKKKSGK